MFIFSDLTPFSLTFNCFKVELIVTIKMIYKTHFSKMAHRTLWFSYDDLVTENTLFSENLVLKGISFIIYKLINFG